MLGFVFGLRIRLWPFAASFALAVSSLGCAPKIGDSCNSSVDCSQQGDRLCDTSQPGGYCTVFNCTGNSCPDNSACMLFNPGVPGCAYNDREPLARSGRSFCIKTCSSNDDCRGGYICANPLDPPWGAKILDDNQNQTVCLVAYSSIPDASAAQNSPVCENQSPPGPDGGWWGSESDAGAAGDASLDTDGSDAADAPSDAPTGG